MTEWSVERLAELHADGLDESAPRPTSEVDPDQDPAAGEVLAALEATRAELGALPELPVPADVRDRIAAALDAAALDGEVRTADADRGGPARTDRSER